MDTGISNEVKIAPKPIPVKGIPFVNNMGGKIVPNKAMGRPQLKNIPKENP